MSSVQRIAAYLEYDGQGFVGWQSQRGLRSVQHCVEEALSTVAAHPVTVRCAGRTDTGVHAIGQVIHFDTTAERTLRGWMLGVNANLPSDINIYALIPVPATFDARFLAIQRRYRYLIWNAAARSAIWSGRCYYEPRPLELESMQTAAKHLLGEHDFSAFRGRDCQAKSPVKTLHRCALSRQGDWIILDIEAGGFLHNMVRNIVGSLVEVGRGAKSPGWVAEVMQSRDRRQAGPTAPPGGLYFVGAKYAEEFSLPAFRRLVLPA